MKNHNKSEMDKADIEVENLSLKSIETLKYGNLQNNSRLRCNEDELLSIYIHWPFCLSLCPYCDFNSHLYDDSYLRQLLEAYCRQINLFSHKIKGKKIRSIFFGGGTPSLMPPKFVYKIIDAISKIADLMSDTEITLESNPTSFEAEKFIEFKKYGINRLSIGVQSFNNNELIFLGRKHSVSEAEDVLKFAKDNFENFSFDLIYGLPDQSLETWQRSLRWATKFIGGHISLYQLTIEKGTEFFKLEKQGKINLPNDDILAQMYEWTGDYLRSFGYNKYEISNYSIDKKECKHNLNYWRYGEYIGIGPGAHSRLINKDEVLAIVMIHDPKKWVNEIINKNTEANIINKKYIGDDDINIDKNNGIQGRFYLSKEEKALEFILMSSRLGEGINLENFYKIVNLDIKEAIDYDILKRYQDLELIYFDEKVIKILDKGSILQNFLLKKIIKPRLLS